MVDLEDIRRARGTITGVVHRTPLFSSVSLGKITGTDLYLKAENLQKTGSFKVRGAANKISTLNGEESGGVITVSSGNHGQATAYVAGKASMPAVIMVPKGTPSAKIEAASAYGAEVIVGGDLNDVDEIIGRALALAGERNLSIVHPFDDPLIIAGQGTIGLELLEDLPRLEAVIVPVGGGGLIAGIAAALKLSNPAVQVYGTGPQGACSLARSFGEKEPVQLSDMPETIADGIRTPTCGYFTLPLVQRYVEDVVTVTDEEILAALRLIWERCKLVVEPAAAAPLAALLAQKIKLPDGTRTACVLSGGNVDLGKVKNWFK
jgi:threonine dehydratase